MEIISFLIIVALVLVVFKALGLIVKAGIFLLSIPLQIVIAVFITALILIVVPVTLATGFLAILLAPLGLLIPLLPFLLISLGIYMFSRR